tara:strand:+ start:1635 stop:2909 length:1275 start_codon:yes stop_codon:yes gene_type:complete
VPTNLDPISTQSAVILTSTGSTAEVAAAVPFGIYTGSADFISGAATQVAYTYRKLGGDVIDIELTRANVYSSYEEAVLEYSYIVNLHQGKNVLSSVLGNTTGTFDHKGDLKTGPAGVNLTYPRFQVGYGKKVADNMAAIGGFGGTISQYSASFKPVTNKQDYNLQEIVNDASTSGVDSAGNAVPFSGAVDGKRIIVTQVFYKSPRAMWRFYGYYGGIGAVGNMSTYGQFSDDSTFEVIPAWQNKMQAMMYEDNIYTRTSHFSYEIISNNLRLYPNPGYWDFSDVDRVWLRFYVDDQNAWEENSEFTDGTQGVNNLNTIPFDNIPYKNINSMGKQWIRKYALAVSKEMLGQIRGKFTTIPIPGESVTLNHSELLAQSKEEQQQLKDKLHEMLKEVEYKELVKYDSETSEATATIYKGSPLPIFVG